MLQIIRQKGTLLIRQKGPCVLERSHDLHNVHWCHFVHRNQCSLYHQRWYAHGKYDRLCVIHRNYAETLRFVSNTLWNLGFSHEMRNLEAISAFLGIVSCSSELHHAIIVIAPDVGIKLGPNWKPKGGRFMRLAGEMIMFLGCTNKL